jgi:hypothetical protein
VRSIGSFNITTTAGTIQGLNHRFFHAIHRADGYSYTYEVASCADRPAGLAARISEVRAFLAPRPRFLYRG